jgi:hypothetical protein
MVVEDRQRRLSVPLSSGSIVTGYVHIDISLAQRGYLSPRFRLMALRRPVPRSFCLRCIGRTDILSPRRRRLVHAVGVVAKRLVEHRQLADGAVDQIGPGRSLATVDVGLNRHKERIGGVRKLPEDGRERARENRNLATLVD